MSQSEYHQLLSMQRGERVSIAPATAVGWTHVWGEGEQFALTSEQAASLAYCGLIFYSPWDGPNARVYRLCDGVTMNNVKGAVGG